MSEELQQKLRDQLWEVANKLRGNMSASDFMYFTLGFIFYKYLSEKIEKHANDALVDDEVTFKELWAMEKDEDVEALQEEVKTECLENIGYFIEPGFLFSSVIESIKRKENILPMLERSLKRIEDSTLGQDSEEDFGGLFSDIDLASPKLGKTADDKNTLVSNVLLALDDIDFGVEASQEIDILGDAYEYMISQFAAGAGKKAGEFYTPQEVSRILAEIVTIGHARLRNVYDPTCGSGSLLLRAASIGHANEIFGQEKNPTTYNLARMNMLLHGIKFSNFRIENGDTLEADAFGDTQFDAVVANPPFSAEWSAADKFNNDDRFSKAGRLAPRKTADYAFILHMIYHLNEGGTMACVAPMVCCSVAMPRALSAVSSSRRRTMWMPSSDFLPISSMAQASRHVSWCSRNVVRRTTTSSSSTQAKSLKRSRHRTSSVHNTSRRLLIPIVSARR